MPNIPEWLATLRDGFHQSGEDLLFHCPKDLLTLLDWTTPHQGQVILILSLSQFPLPRECPLCYDVCWEEPVVFV